MRLPILFQLFRCCMTPNSVRAESCRLSGASFVVVRAVNEALLCAVSQLCLARCVFGRDPTRPSSISSCLWTIGCYELQQVALRSLSAAEMGRELRGARDVDVGVPGFLGVDQGARPNNVGCCRPCGSAMGGSGVFGCLTSPQPQSLALAACGGKIVCSGCSAW